MPSVAIIGASNDPAKYGSRAVRAYLRQGWTVYPVNPNEDVVEGQKVYARIEDVPKPVDRITVYVPPDVGRGLLPSFKQAAPGAELFINPGAEDEAFMKAAEDLGLEPIYACSILEIGERP